MPATTANKLVKQLQAAGFIETRCKGDHHRFEDKKGHKVTGPYKNKKDEIGRALYSSIKRQAGW